MKCGTCKAPMRDQKQLRDHWSATGCAWLRPVWEKVAEARRRGRSGRRLLGDAYPHLFKSEPMSEETKARLREIAADQGRVTKARVRARVKARSSSRRER